MKNVAPRRRLSLKWKLIGMILFWVLPLVILGAIAGTMITNNVKNQVGDTARSSGVAASQVVAERINSAVSASRYASYDSTIKVAFQTYMRTPEPTRNLDIYRAVTALLEERYRDDDKFLFTVFSFYPHDNYLNGLNCSTYPTSDRYEMLRDYLHTDQSTVMKLAEQADTQIGFYYSGGALYMYRNVFTPSYVPIGVLVMRLDREVLLGSMKNIPWATDIVVSLNGADIPLLGRAERTNPYRTFIPEEGAIFLSDLEMPFLLGASLEDGYRLSYRVRIDSSAMLESLQPFQWLLAAAILLLIPLLLLAIRFFYTNVAHPVAEMVKGSREIEQGGFGTQVPTNAKSREFQYLANSFNEMSARLRDQFEHIYREEIALRDAKIKALQSQINPHFLNNTLEIINWEARIAGDIKVSRMIESLSTMLDAAMDRKGKPMVHLSEEMMYVNAYLYIINERLGKRLTVYKEVDDTLLDMLVPRLLLQPIIENAVEHGITPLQKGNIYIRVLRCTNENSAIGGNADDAPVPAGGCVWIEVENDGAMSEEDEQNVEKLLSDSYDTSGENSGNIGIRNVHMRLRIIFGSSSGLTIRRTPNGHALARIVIPLAGEQATDADKKILGN